MKGARAGMEFNLKDVSFILAILIDILVPLLLAVFISRKYKVSWAIFFLGMLMFIASMIRIPLNNYVSGIIQGKFTSFNAILVTVAFASLTAGIFEETVRALGIGYIIKKKNFSKGLMYGVGHGGGGEAMLFVGLSLAVNYIIFKFFPDTLPKLALNQYLTMQWYIPLIGAMERIFAIAIQISLSVLVMYAFMHKKYYLIAAAVAYHAAVDFIAVYLNHFFGIIAAEAAVFIFALGSVLFTVLIGIREKKNTLKEETAV
jgi:uncharacterized membrane protein YhfC